MRSNAHKPDPRSPLPRWTWQTIQVAFLTQHTRCPKWLNFQTFESLLLAAREYYWAYMLCLDVGASCGPVGVILPCPSPCKGVCMGCCTTPIPLERQLASCYHGHVYADVRITLFIIMEYQVLILLVRMRRTHCARRPERRHLPAGVLALSVSGTTWKQLQPSLVG